MATFNSLANLLVGKWVPNSTEKQGQNLLLQTWKHWATRQWSEQFLSSKKLFSFKPSAVICFGFLQLICFLQILISRKMRESDQLIIFNVPSSQLAWSLLQRNLPWNKKRLSVCNIQLPFACFYFSLWVFTDDDTRNYVARFVSAGAQLDVKIVLCQRSAFSLCNWRSRDNVSIRGNFLPLLKNKKLSTSLRKLEKVHKTSHSGGIWRLESFAKPEWQLFLWLASFSHTCRKLHPVKQTCTTCVQVFFVPVAFFCFSGFSSETRDQNQTRKKYFAKEHFWNHTYFRINDVNWSPGWKANNGYMSTGKVFTYLGEVEFIQRYALLFNPFHGSCLLVHSLGLLGQVQVQHRNTPGFDVSLCEWVHHEHDPDGSLAFPVAGEGVEEVVGVQAAAALVGRHPHGHHELHVLEVPLQAPVQTPRQQVRQRLSRRQQLTVGQRGNRVRICQV